MSSVKHLPVAILSIEEVNKWLLVLSTELAGRVFEEFEDSNRWPKTFQVNHLLYLLKLNFIILTFLNP